jgi:uncharacterized protein YjiS (DUF1127 family)
MRMSITQELPTVPRRTTTKTSFAFLKPVGSRLCSVIRALIAGMVASKDYRHLNGMTEQQLRLLGLTRKDIPAELYRRHFRRLNGFSAPGE